MTTALSVSWLDSPLGASQVYLSHQSSKPPYFTATPPPSSSRNRGSLVLNQFISQFEYDLSPVWIKWNMLRVLDRNELVDDLPLDLDLIPSSKRKIKVRVKSVKIAKFRFIDDEEIDFNQLDEW
jgi:hypothetical protein